MRTSADPAGPTPETLLARWRAEGRPGDLAALFDATAPELFRLALHLCPDAATAEDVVQETFLAVLERASAWDPQRPALPWLTGILKNQALMARRRAARRPDPGRLDAPVVPDDPAFAAADAEETERLREAMSALPEPLRGVALLRWRYGLEPAAIAEVKGVPPGTVRSWLHRAVERLRVGMVTLPALLLAFQPSRGLKGVRRSVLRRAARRLLPGRAATTAAASTLATATVGAAVTKIALASSLAVLLAGIGGWLLLGGSDGDDAAGGRGTGSFGVPVASGPGAGRRPGARPDVDEAAATGAAATPAAAAEAFDGVEVEVTVRGFGAPGNKSLRPIEGARVSLFRACRRTGLNRKEPPEADRFPGRVTANPVRTDEKGRALLRIPNADVAPDEWKFSPDPGPPVFLYAVHETGVAVLAVGDLPKSGRVQRDLRLAEPATVKGVVRHLSDEVVPGVFAWLRLDNWNEIPVRADGSGRFRFPTLSTELAGQFYVTVQAPGTLEERATVRASQASQTDLALVLNPHYTLRGRCVNPAFSPLEGLRVLVDIGDPDSGTMQHRTTTAADGTFAVEAIDGWQVTLSVDGGPLGVRTIPMVRPVRSAVHDLGDIVLEKGREIRGRLLREDGRPEPDALVLLLPYPFTTFTPVLARARTDAEGHFSFTVAGDAGRQAGLIEYQDDRRFGLAFVRGQGAVAGAPPADDKENTLLFNRRDFDRAPVGPKDEVQRFVIGGLRVMFRLTAADPEKPALPDRVQVQLRPESGSGAHSGGSRPRLPGREFTAYFDVKAPGVYCPEVVAEGFEFELPASVLVSEEQETLVEVKVRKMQ